MASSDCNLRSGVQTLAVDKGTVTRGFSISAAAEELAPFDEDMPASAPKPVETQWRKQRNTAELTTEHDAAQGRDTNGGVIPADQLGKLQHLVAQR